MASQTLITETEGRGGYTFSPILDITGYSELCKQHKEIVDRALSMMGGLSYSDGLTILNCLQWKIKAAAMITVD